MSTADLHDARGPRVVGLLLAAGRGTRFDPSGRNDKLLQPIDGVAVVERSARRLAEATGHVIAVVRSLDCAVAHVLAAVGCELVECPQAIGGMGHSLAGGAQRLRRDGRWHAAAVALGDMPDIEPSTIRSLIARLDTRATIVVPIHAGHAGHPVVFASAHFDALATSTGDRGARALLDGPGVIRVEVTDPGVLRDIDTPADLVR